MRDIFVFIFGYRRFAVPDGYAAELLELLKRVGIITSEPRFCDGKLFFRASLAASSRLMRECGRAGIPLELISSHGVPEIARRYRKRAGVVIGILLCAAIIFFSGTVIWDIRVDGNSRLSDEEVIAELRECGLRLGKVRRRLDTDSIQNRVMINSDDISWISINIIGTVAEVQIRESAVVPEPEDYYDAANIVAAKDGFIERFEDTRGNVLLDVGELVREGELIVSGLYGSETEGFRYTSAKGRVMARTETLLSASIPFVYDKKVYTGREFSEKYLIFFEKEVKFFGKCGNLPTSCDTIDTVEYCNFFSAGELPVGIRTVRYLEYEVVSDVRSEDEARKLAESALKEKLSDLSREVELLRKSTSFSIGEEGITAECKVEAIEDIAKIQEIIIS